MKRVMVLSKYVFVMLLHMADIITDLIYIKIVPKYNTIIKEKLVTYMYPALILHGIFLLVSL